MSVSALLEQCLSAPKPQPSSNPSKRRRSRRPLRSPSDDSDEDWLPGNEGSSSSLRKSKRFKSESKSKDIPTLKECAEPVLKVDTQNKYDCVKDEPNRLANVPVKTCRKKRNTKSLGAVSLQESQMSGSQDVYLDQWPHVGLMCNIKEGSRDLCKVCGLFNI